jgi:DNA-binding response OmpR family regulator
MQKRIMIVDDDPGLLKLVGMMLQRGGYSVSDAISGFSALDMLDEDDTGPDLFILDVMMPKMTGIELVEHLRARPQTAESPVLMLSAFGDEKIVNSAMKAGADAYLVKPVQHKMLLEKVGSLLEM